MQSMRRASQLLKQYLQLNKQGNRVVSRLLCSNVDATTTANDVFEPGLDYFLKQAHRPKHASTGLFEASSENLQILEASVDPPSCGLTSSVPLGRKLYLETYGCQMNVNDSEVVLSILLEHGYTLTQDLDAADAVLVNTCAIRDNAEQRVWARLGLFKSKKLKRREQRRSDNPLVVGVLGCMAERLKQRLLESDKLVDIVAGPDAYRDLPRLIQTVQEAECSSSSRATAINVQLSLEETYADIVPVRRAGATSAFISIMRGCNNMCSFCIVPFTRGRERSRPIQSILDEVRLLSDSGVKEVTLLGQNVNSYADWSQTTGEETAQQQLGEPSASGRPTDPFSVYAKGFKSVYKPRRSGAVQFAELLDRVADIDPEMRIRFTSPHPKDFADDVLQVIRDRPNVCNHLHMPAQSGSSSVLERMRRGYSREAYDELVHRVRSILPQVALSTDIIVGFCGENEREFAQTLDLMREVGYDQAFMFAYSQRHKTAAARYLPDDVSKEVKSRRLQEVIAMYRETLAHRNEAEVGRRHLVLIEGASKRSPSALTGRTCSMKRVVFDNMAVPGNYILHSGISNSIGSSSSPSCGTGQSPSVDLQVGDYVAVHITHSSAGTLFGVPIARTSLAEFIGNHSGSSLPVERYEYPGVLQCETQAIDSGLCYA